MRIVVAGGTGFLGSALVTALQRDGHAVTVLTRRPNASHHARWDPAGALSTWAQTLEDVDAVINLAGAPINHRWTAAHKRAMWNSRVTATRTLVAAMKSVRRIPPTLLNASAVGVYGPRGDEPITEESGSGSGFLAGLGAAWEKEAMAAGPHARTVLLRSGVILDRDGGALPQMALPFRLFVGGPLGSGTQYISWIHRNDWVSMVRWALMTTAVAGPLNATAPNPVTSAEFARALGKALHRPAIMPTPAFALKLVLGEMAEVLLAGQRVFPEKAHALGFEFQYPTVESALRAIYP
ncbi:MAG: TIGR01777 family protein [Acidobacteria bacterium RIFCSPLOWO2_12_FULL_67_14]|nr:MAG: TIGR01777 family protein [Acidobacteria bacterium RIFCSPLOWO2_12_FULL_67_14]